MPEVDTALVDIGRRVEFRRRHALPAPARRHRQGARRRQRHRSDSDRRPRRHTDLARHVGRQAQDHGAVDHRLRPRKRRSPLQQQVRKLPREGGEFTCMSGMMRMIADKVVTQIPATAQPHRRRRLGRRQRQLQSRGTGRRRARRTRRLRRHHQRPAHPRRRRGSRRSKAGTAITSSAAPAPSCCPPTASRTLAAPSARSSSSKSAASHRRSPNTQRRTETARPAATARALANERRASDQVSFIVVGWHFQRFTVHCGWFSCQLARKGGASSAHWTVSMSPSTGSV